MVQLEILCKNWTCNIFWTINEIVVIVACATKWGIKNIMSTYGNNFRASSSKVAKDLLNSFEPEFIEIMEESRMPRDIWEYIQAKDYRDMQRKFYGRDPETLLAVISYINGRVESGLRDPHRGEAEVAALLKIIEDAHMVKEQEYFNM